MNSKRKKNWYELFVIPPSPTREPPRPPSPVHPLWLNAAVGLVNQRPPQEIISSATLPVAYERYSIQCAVTGGRKRIYRGKHSHRGNGGCSRSTRGSEFWSSSSRAAAPLKPELMYSLDFNFICLKQAQAEWIIWATKQISTCKI